MSNYFRTGLLDVSLFAGVGAREKEREENYVFTLAVDLIKQGADHEVALAGLQLLESVSPNKNRIVRLRELSQAVEEEDVASQLQVLATFFEQSLRQPKRE
jgi:hypothetical protein